MVPKFLDACAAMITLSEDYFKQAGAGSHGVIAERRNKTLAGPHPSTRNSEQVQGMGHMAIQG
jgi:hypothetical protein